MKRYDYLIVGAGLFGAVFACEATRQGKSCLVIERRSHIAGNAYTQEVEGIQVHRYGAHIFHTADKAIWDYVQSFGKFNDFVNTPLAVYKGERYNLPFNMNTFRQMWGVETPQEAQAKIAEQIVPPPSGTPVNLEEQALALVGKDIYQKLIKGYTEKQWGRDCKDLPAFLLKRLPLRFVYDNNYFDDPYQGIPVEGYTALVAKMLQGVEVLLDTDYFEFCTTHPDIADKTLFTGPIDRFFDYCFGPLQYRSVRFETQVLDVADYQGVAVVNYTDKDVPFTRSIEHKHFAFGTQPKTVVSREYSSEWHVGIEPYYPVNDPQNEALYARYAALAKERVDVIFGGRLGQYRYLDMDKTIQAALAAVRQTV